MNSVKICYVTYLASYDREGGLLLRSMEEMRGEVTRLTVVS